MELLEQSHCHPKEQLGDCVGKVLVLDGELLLPDEQCVENQLWFAVSGVGCYTENENNTIRAISLYQNVVESIFQRKQFIGEVKEEFIPHFAVEARMKIMFSQAELHDWDR